MVDRKVHIGTSGWSYKDWIGIFYPKNLKATEWLSHYSKTFDCTEINSSFYRLPQKQTVTNWGNKVPKGFLFCPKMSRYLTHIKRLKEPEEPLERFFSIFKSMQKQMGPVLIQLPKIVPYDNKVAGYFYKSLKEKYSSYEFAMEVRHESWMTEESSDLFNKWLAEGHEPWIFFNNDWYGYGIDNALTLRRFLK